VGGLATVCPPPNRRDRCFCIQRCLISFISAQNNSN